MRWQLQLHNGTWSIVLEPPGHRGHGNQAQDEHHQQHQRQQSHHQQGRRASSRPLAPAQPRHCLLTLVVKIPKLKTLNPHRSTFESKVHTLQSIATPVSQSQEEAYNILPVVTSLAPVLEISGSDLTQQSLQRICPQRIPKMLGATLGSTFQWCYRHPRGWPSKFEREICQRLGAPAIDYWKRSGSTWPSCFDGGKRDEHYECLLNRWWNDPCSSALSPSVYLCGSVRQNRRSRTMKLECNEGLFGDGVGRIGGQSCKFPTRWETQNNSNETDPPLSDEGEPSYFPRTRDWYPDHGAQGYQRITREVTALVYSCWLMTGFS